MVENREQFKNFVMSIIERRHGDVMKSTVENSEWHREENVFVHTQMVVNEFMQRSVDFSFNEFRLGLIVCAYHDTGKYWVRQEHPNGGFSFYNHEVNSANILRNDYWVDPEVRAIFSDDEAEMNFVRFLIQTHLPYKMQGKQLSVLKASIIYYGDQAMLTAEQSLKIFKNCILSDAMGRISDNHADKIENVYTWFSNFDNLDIFNFSVNDSFPILTMVSGAMGAGKTTMVKEMIENYKNEGIQTIYISFDEIRNTICEREFGANYTNEQLHACDALVNGEVTKRLVQIRKSFKKDQKLVVFVDTTFVTRRRRIFIKECMKIGSVDFIEINKPLSWHLTNNTKRTGREFVPQHTVKTSYFSTCMPLVDEIFYAEQK